MHRSFTTEHMDVDLKS